MASQIDTTNLDAAYPVPGIDNDSQGFRDNFSNIKDNLDFAKSEITDLQNNTAKTDENTDFNNNDVSRANFIQTTEEVYIANDLANSQNISFNNGNYQSITVKGTDNITLRLADWPASGKLGKIRVIIAGNGTDITPITWSTTGGGTLRYDSNFPDPFTVESNTSPKVVDFWSDSAGTIVYCHYIGEFSA